MLATARSRRGHSGLAAGLGGLGPASSLRRARSAARRRLRRRARESRYRLPPPASRRELNWARRRTSVATLLPGIPYAQVPLPAVRRRRRLAARSGATALRLLRLRARGRRGRRRAPQLRCRERPLAAGARAAEHGRLGRASGKSYRCASCGAVETARAGARRRRLRLLRHARGRRDRPPIATLVRPARSRCRSRSRAPTRSARFRAWLGSLWFRPNDLKRHAELESMRGVYVPFWTFDADSRSRWSAEAGYRRGVGQEPAHRLAAGVGNVSSTASTICRFRPRAASTSTSAAVDRTVSDRADDALRPAVISPASSPRSTPSTSPRRRAIARARMDETLRAACRARGPGRHSAATSRSRPSTRTSLPRAVWFRSGSPPTATAAARSATRSTAPPAAPPAPRPGRGEDRPRRPRRPRASGPALRRLLSALSAAPRALAPRPARRRDGPSPHGTFLASSGGRGRGNSPGGEARGRHEPERRPALHRL